MNLEHLFQKAQKENWAIGQFNFSTIEILKAAIFAAQKLKAPIIVGTSEGESKFFGLKEAVSIVNSLKNIWPSTFLSLDHGKGFNYIKKAIDAGYDYVHFDGSDLPLNENIRITREVVKYAKKRQVLVEGEIGIIGTAKDKKGILTEPNEALDFFEKTKVAGLAISIGNIHGIETNEEKINFGRLKEIKEKFKNNPFLVLHGGSWISKEVIVKAIKLGIVKININTELRLAYKKTLSQIFKGIPDEIVPYKYLPKVIEAVQKIIEGKILLFGSAKKV